MDTPIRVLNMNRSLELRVKGHLYEIAAVNDEVLDTRQGLPMAEKGYWRTLTSVADCASAEMVDGVAESIKEHIRTEGNRPDNRSVRRDARMRIAEEGIVPDTYLNKA